MAGALDGYRVLECGGYVASQVLGMLLADQGAEVVKLEPPGGDAMRGGAAFAVWNRGKKSVAVGGAGGGAGAGVVERLAATADALICDGEGGDVFGASLDGLEAANPRLVSVAMPAFGPEHPDAGLPPLEPLVAAASGVYIDRGGGGPSLISVPHASIFGALTAAPALVAALLAREATGRGQRVVLPLYDAMFGAMGAHLTRLPDAPGLYAQAGHPVVARFYECADGRWINLNAGYARALEPMVAAFGHPDWAAALLDTDSLLAHPEERALWIETLTAVWKTRPALEWEGIMADAGVPATMCRTIDEWLASGQAAAMGAVVSVDDADFGAMRQVGVQVHMGDGDGVPLRRAPRLGEHTRELLGGG